MGKVVIGPGSETPAASVDIIDFILFLLSEIK